MKFSLGSLTAVVIGVLTVLTVAGRADDPAAPKLVEGVGPGWVALGDADFTNVNCDDSTWKWDGNLAHCTGQPIGVIRTKKPYTNFELVATWRHLKAAGNSGIFVWSPLASLDGLKRGKLPEGVELQVLDHGYKEQHEKSTGKKADWFTTHGDVFPVGKTKMKPFAPTSPNGQRSFPRKNVSKGVGEWNHYYARCVGGEVRLSVNGEEVSGGSGCEPATGYICLESEGSPVEFKDLRLRELP